MDLLDAVCSFNLFISGLMDLALEKEMLIGCSFCHCLPGSPISAYSFCTASIGLVLHICFSQSHYHTQPFCDQWSQQECGVMCFTEAWQMEYIPELDTLPCVCHPDT